MQDLSDRHAATQHVAQFFEYDHLTGKPRSISAECHELAEWLIDVLPDDPELTAGLRKLLEAKDCFIRAAVTVKRESVAYREGGSDSPVLHT